MSTTRRDADLSRLPSHGHSAHPDDAHDLTGEELLDMLEIIRDEELTVKPDMAGYLARQLVRLQVRAELPRPIRDDLVRSRSEPTGLLESLAPSAGIWQGITEVEGDIDEPGADLARRALIGDTPETPETPLTDPRWPGMPAYEIRFRRSCLGEAPETGLKPTETTLASPAYRGLYDLTLTHNLPGSQVLVISDPDGTVEYVTPQTAAHAVMGPYRVSLREPLRHDWPAGTSVTFVKRSGILMSTERSTPTDG